MNFQEDIYKYITEKAPDIIYTISLDAKITFHNKSIEKVFDTTIEEIEKNHYAHMMLPKDKEFAKKMHQERLQGKSSVFEHGFQTPNGKVVYLEISATPIFDKTGKVIGSLGIARDVTDRRKAQDELKKSKEELEELVQLKDKFLSIIAHDLRDPFNVLIGYSDLILSQIESLSTENLTKYVQAINTSSNNGYNLLNNLLDWSITQSGKITYIPEEINLSKVIDHIFEALSYSASAKNIVLKKKMADNLSVTTDENMLKTVLRNLVNNAIKFSFKNGEVALEVIEEKESFIVKISDSGIGIKEDVLPKLFSPEYNLSTAGTANERGTGLGLKICKDFVERWGGQIGVTSIYGNGSVFSFSIPK